MWFPIDTEHGTLISGVWEIDFGSYNNDRVVEWISLEGPGGSVKVYVDNTFVDITARGDFNRADYYKGIPLARGRLFRLVWSLGTGTAPTASLGLSDGNVSVAGL